LLRQQSVRALPAVVVEPLAPMPVEPLVLGEALALLVLGELLELGELLVLGEALALLVLGELLVLGDALALLVLGELLELGELLVLGEALALLVLGELLELGELVELLELGDALALLVLGELLELGELLLLPDAPIADVPLLPLLVLPLPVVPACAVFTQSGRLVLPELAPSVPVLPEPVLEPLLPVEAPAPPLPPVPEVLLPPELPLAELPPPDVPELLELCATARPAAVVRAMAAASVLSLLLIFMREVLGCWLGEIVWPGGRDGRLARLA
jgi:hypothetical protein